MTRQEQANFITELMASIEDDIIAATVSGAIPEEWDGIELREYLYEKALRSRANHHLTGKRGRDYRNTITVNNL